jgi:hypothetical protein
MAALKPLTDEQMAEIKYLYTQNKSLDAIASRYSICVSRVERIATGKTSTTKEYIKCDNKIGTERFEKIVKQLARAKRFWKTFNIGDEVEVKYWQGRRNLYNTGIVSYINDVYMNVECEDERIQVRMDDLILEKHSTKLRRCEA